MIRLWLSWEPQELLHSRWTYRPTRIWMSFFVPYNSIQSGVARQTAVLAWSASVPGIGFIGGTHRLDTRNVSDVAPARASHLPQNEVGPTATIAGRTSAAPSVASRLQKTQPRVPGRVPWPVQSFSGIGWIRPLYAEK